ncbi:hypothetical protein KQI84_05295 [bacterium]|nr:hypothetical protein [bacterium]
MSPETRPPAISVPPDHPVTGVVVDGNSLLAAVVSMTSTGEPVVHATRTMELDSLVERIARVNHPIFMDVDFLEFPSPEILVSQLNNLLEGDIFQNPLVVVFPPEITRCWQERGPAGEEARADRIRRGLKGIRNSNPYSYPMLLAFDETKTKCGGEATRFWSTRLDDLMASADLYNSIALPFQALVQGHRAGAEILRLLSAEEPDSPMSLVDVGKLRTLYLGGCDGELVFNHAIPVGLARDDIFYFTAIKPVMSYLHTVAEQFGTLLFPPDSTPSPIFDPVISTPQVDCTRFSMQVARYAYRVLHDIWGETCEPREVVHYVTGRPSRLPGFRQYLDVKTGARFRRLDRRPIESMHLAEGIGWPQVADHLLPIGAAMAYHRRKEDRYGLVLRSRRPSRLTDQLAADGQLKPNDLYLIEAPDSDKTR